jgi:hypothetical protein
MWSQARAVKVAITPPFLANFRTVTPNKKDPKEPPPPAASEPASFGVSSGVVSRPAASEFVRFAASAPVAADLAPRSAPLEIGGRDGPDPTRYGDWELRGRCIDF